MDALVSPAWLADHLDDVRPIDATLLDAGLGRDARAEFAAGHVPGAAFLDLASLRDLASPLPNMMPAADAWADRLARLGIGGAEPIVFYDASPWRTAARAWFMARHFGHAEVAILDGGWARWQAEGRPVETGEATPAPATSGPASERDDVRTLAQVRNALAAGTTQLIDARSASRFTGAEPDPHGAAAGHMPGALNLPYPQLFLPDGRWKRGRELSAAFNDAGIDPDRPAIATCGSGITAAVLLFGLHLLGRDGALYDGSWSEWGADPATAKATG